MDKIQFLRNISDSGKAADFMGKQESIGDAGVWSYSKFSNNKVIYKDRDNKEIVVATLSKGLSGDAVSAILVGIDEALKKEGLAK